jgi:hypothetical protein
MARRFQVKVAGNLKNVRRLDVRDSGVWKRARNAWVKVAGVWKPFLRPQNEIIEVGETALPEVLHKQLAWSGDGNLYYFAKDSTGDGLLYRLNPSSGVPTFLDTQVGVTVGGLDRYQGCPIGSNEVMFVTGRGLTDMQFTRWNRLSSAFVPTAPWVVDNRAFRTCLLAYHPATNRAFAYYQGGDLALGPVRRFAQYSPSSNTWFSLTAPAHNIRTMCILDNTIHAMVDNGSSVRVMYYGILDAFPSWNLGFFVQDSWLVGTSMQLEAIGNALYLFAYKYTTNEGRLYKLTGLGGLFVLQTIDLPFGGDFGFDGTHQAPLAGGSLAEYIAFLHPYLMTETVSPPILPVFNATDKLFALYGDN